MKLDRQGQALAAALSAESARLEWLQQASDRSNLAMDLLINASAKANWSKLKLNEAMAVASLPGSLLEEWLSVLESGSGPPAPCGLGFDPDGERGGLSPRRPSRRASSKERSDASMMGLDAETPAHEGKIRHKARRGITKHDSLDRISWSISSISETGEADADRDRDRDRDSLCCPAPPSPVNLPHLLTNVDNDGLDLPLKQRTSLGRRSSQSTEPLFGRPPSRNGSSGSRRLAVPPLQLPGVLETEIINRSIIDIRESFGSTFGAREGKGAAKMPCRCVGPTDPDAGVLKEVPFTLSSPALNLVQIARQSFRAAYRNWRAGEELALKALELDEGGAAEAVTAVVLRVNSTNSLTDEMVDLKQCELLKDGPLVEMTASEVGIEERLNH